MARARKSGTAALRHIATISSAAAANLCVSNDGLSTAACRELDKSAPGPHTLMCTICGCPRHFGPPRAPRAGLLPRPAARRPVTQRPLWGPIPVRRGRGVAPAAHPAAGLPWWHCQQRCPGAPPAPSAAFWGEWYLCPEGGRRCTYTASQHPAPAQDAAPLWNTSQQNNTSTVCALACNMRSVMRVGGRNLTAKHMSTTCINLAGTRSDVRSAPGGDTVLIAALNAYMAHACALGGWKGESGENERPKL